VTVTNVALLTDGFYPIELGFLVYGKADYYGKKYRSALKPMLVQTARQNILIDTGFSKVPPEYEKFARKEPGPGLVEQLGKLGLEPRDIHVIVNTHLHYDHAGNNNLFPDAVAVVQRTEIEYAKDPHRFQKGGYIPELYAKTPLEAIEGEKEITPGVRLVPTPGHTPGHQSVVVEWRSQRFVYTGDICPLRENYERRNVVGILYNPVDALASIDKLRALGGTPVFSHDHDQLSL
jgi:glyoxylase-like metal-dependent hydrolase (beta-lactamase superfamily II)